MALISLLAESTGPFLVNQLDKPERGLESVGKNDLDIALIDG